MSTLEQPSLLDETWPCPACNATGSDVDPETQAARRCPMCRGARVLEFDPNDKSEIPF